MLKSKSGILQILEFSLPQEGILAPLARFALEYVVPLIGKLVAGSEHHAEYMHLTNSIKTFPSPVDFVQELVRAGFRQCSSPINVFQHVVYLYTCS